MARTKSKLCPSCHTLFRGRSNAKTCSDRCRKRLQRAAEDLRLELAGGQIVKFTAERKGLVRVGQ